MALGDKTYIAVASPFYQPQYVGDMETSKTAVEENARAYIQAGKGNLVHICQTVKVMRQTITEEEIDGPV